ncbi:hypothetical protein AGABI1DRAFT_130241 [Agaricus bisporus var. burnettii JB137-S8]|uniref:F-box domain-containing protein n=1 Tax=Agaricus bisporus var. burnettii (strain JB137-S8 / ATCC MYA-4627 / FGSC 10392) TaxID=597362 RepID=K5XRN3_AGABU|nr:uncharacterized protein AGABI1DRAFT_130241 [Agaricus bisporus var. burnettii JB137-S8]EKM77545.1 hypothetical protein AGABI1DRAFT_130241 [Agaricus bisporus var. burnettii JB137-S8]
MATTFNDLPQELCNRIVRFFRHDRQTLLKLCLTSVRLVNEAQSYIYAALIIDNIKFPTTIYKSFNLLLTLTVHNPSLAKYVDAFGYRIQRLPEDHAVYEKLRHAIRLMVNVTWLEINTTIPHSPQGFFDGCTFRLRHFRCQFASSDKPAIYKMLSTQPSLRSLYIDEFDQDFPSDCCLKLNRLCVEDWRSIEQILPGRSILGLELLPIEGLMPVVPFSGSVPPSITTQLGNLTHLTFRTDTPYDFLEIMGPHLTRLMILRIIGRDLKNESRKNIAKKPEILCKLTNLKIFIWSLEIYCDYRNMTSEEVCELYNVLWDPLELWFRELPKLKAVYTLDFDSHDFDDEGYYHLWSKDKSPRAVDVKVALGGKSLYTR